jgi:hypothetical protein
VTFVVGAADPYICHRLTNAPQYPVALWYTSVACLHDTGSTGYNIHLTPRLQLNRRVMCALPRSACGLGLILFSIAGVSCENHREAIRMIEQVDLRTRLCLFSPPPRLWRSRLDCEYTVE